MFFRIFPQQFYAPNTTSVSLGLPPSIILRLIFRLLTLTVALFISSFAPALERTPVVVWGVGYGKDSKGLEAVVNEFERRNPDLKVKVSLMGAGTMSPQKLMTAIVGNAAPDVIQQDRFTISDWASRGAFEILDPLLKRDQADPYSPKANDYYEFAWKEAQHNGKQMGIPVTADTRLLFWNKDIFRKKSRELIAAGLDPNRPPRTWSELLAYSKVLTEFNADGSIKIAGFLPNYGNVWLYMYAFQQNASFMSADGSVCTMNSPEAQKALQFMVDGYDLVGGFENARNFQSGFQSNENDAFIVGKIAMKIDGNWFTPTLARWAGKMDYGASEPPVPDDRFERKGAFQRETDQFITWGGGFAYAIPKGARNLEGGWRFIKWASSLEARLLDMKAQSDWDRRLGRAYIPNLIPMIPANKAAETLYGSLDPRVLNARKVAGELLKVARFRPKTTVAQLLWDEHVRAVENATLKKKTVAQSLQLGQDAVNQELEELQTQGKYPVVNPSLPIYMTLGIISALGAFAFYRYKKLRLGNLMRGEARSAYFMIAPWVVGFLIFTLGPMIASLFYSFTRYDVLNQAYWVGGKNYQDLLGRDQEFFLKSLSNVFYLGSIGVPLSIVTGLSVAMLLNSAVRGMRTYRTFFYMPSIVPTVASAVLWSWILSSDPSKGLINGIWASTISEWFGTQPPGWLNSESWSKPALIVMGLWGAGGGMVLWLAGLKGIPTTLYEASAIDGATPGKQFWTVTLPQLSRIIFFNTVMGFIGALQEFERVYIMKPGDTPGTGPADSLLVPVFQLFTYGFNYFKMGAASALAWVIFIIVVALTLIQFVLAPRWVHYEVEK